MILFSFLCTNLSTVARALVSVHHKTTTRTATPFVDLPSLRIHNVISSPRISTAMSLCSKSTTNSKKRALYSFEEARKIARGHGFASRQEFLEYDCPGAYQVPKNADEVWAEDWISWEDFLGVPLAFEEAREVARKQVGPASVRKISTEDEYKRLFESKTVNDSDIVSRLPYRPDLKYKTKGWISWDDFLKDSC